MKKELDFKYMRELLIAECEKKFKVHTMILDDISKLHGSLHNPSLTEKQFVNLITDSFAFTFKEYTVIRDRANYLFKTLSNKDIKEKS